MKGKQRVIWRTSELPVAGQKFPQYFKGYLEVFAVFYKSYNIYFTILRGSPRPAKKRYSDVPWPENTGLEASIMFDRIRQYNAK